LKEKGDEFEFQSSEIKISENIVEELWEV